VTKSEKIETAVKTAMEAQLKYDLCSRSAMYGLSKVFNEIPESFIKASASLAGGCGSASGSCGAYCAGLLAVGLRFNSTMAEEDENPEVFAKTSAAFNEYRDKFRARYGTTLCPEIQKQLFGRGYVLYDENDLQEYMKLEGHEEKCAGVVGEAVRIAADMIFDDDN